MHPRVAAALAAPLLGHLDPVFLKILDEIGERLRRLFATENRVTLAISATGGGAREACLVNLIEPGDRVVIGVHGYFGERLAEGARRLGAEVSAVESPWGAPPDVDRLVAGIRACAPAVVGIVHAETSTGVLLRQEEMRAIGAAAREMGALLLVDSVTSLGSVPVEPDDWPADACFSCSQKGLSCPPGFSPVTVGERAMARIRTRRAPVPSLYFDLALLEKYWSGGVYHHTASSSLGIALLESLRLIEEEGIEARFERFARNTRALVAGLESLGLSLLVPPSHRMPMVTPVWVPADVDEAAIRRSLLAEESIEIGAGLGPLAGKIWRVGLMGYSSRPENIRLLLGALGARLARAGHACDPARALAAAERILS